VRNVAREGQHSGKLTKKLSNVVPWSAISLRTLPITRSDSSVWSSVMITTTFGRAAPVTAGAAAVRRRTSVAAVASSPSTRAAACAGVAMPP
jgi:hypothetical protein